MTLVKPTGNTQDDYAHKVFSTYLPPEPREADRTKTHRDNRTVYVHIVDYVSDVARKIARNHRITPVVIDEVHTINLASLLIGALSVGLVCSVFNNGLMFLAVPAFTFIGYKFGRHVRQSKAL